MAVYIVMTKLETLDAEALEAYATASQAAPSEGLRPLIVYGAQEVLEGGPHEGIVVLEFPSREAALAWYESPEYVSARAYRQRGAHYQVTLVDGYSFAR